ncbi:helveticin J family class III bacteriocin [Lactobacillus bombicola]|uniref:helveticin J family class III bacteriocin n=1 Tax=Lactobacillus bombicola TaxID=1505723 RepID=UPI000E58F25C|nr:helveticin J family class III bacteriocin [Lactobacillus bombicola]RHW48913.1 hypothetical protein DS833_06980 [Lactobacillus bombicola]
MILKQSDFSLTLISEIFNKLQGLHNNVIQKVSIVGQNLYALQYNNQQDPHNYVYRARKRHYPLFKQVFNASQMAGGHTQTLDWANQPNMWFIGTKKNNLNWSTQLARVTIPSKSAHTSNTEFARLAYLNRAGRGLKVDDTSGHDEFSEFTGKDFLRFDAAISPQYKTFMLATVDRKKDNQHKGDNGYFILYDLNGINQALDKAAGSYVNLGEIPYLSEFYIKHITAANKIGSLQGFALDDNNNVYLSSEYGPLKGGPSKKPRRIIKMPWGVWGKSNMHEWEILDFDNAEIDIPGYATEFESIQVIAQNDLCLTVSYHNEQGVTTRSRIYRVRW